MKKTCIGKLKLSAKAGQKEFTLIDRCKVRTQINNIRSYFKKLDK